MTVSFVTPLGAVAGLAVLVPLAGTLLSEHRAERLRQTLGLRRPALRSHASAVLAAVSLFVLLAVAGSQPVLGLERTASARADAEAFVVLDISRSMLAAPAAGAPTRFVRAADLAVRVRRALVGVPVGVASMTDRTLPHLFPTADQEAFALVVRGALGIERPPPRDRALRATDFHSLEALAESNYFSPSSVRRLAVLVTDGETRTLDPDRLVRRLERQGIALVVVRLWSRGERIYKRNGRPEAGYRPDPLSLEPLTRLARASAGGRVFDEKDVERVVASARRALGTGPVVESNAGNRLVPLAPYAVLAAALPLAFLLARGNAGGRAAERI